MHLYVLGAGVIGATSAYRLLEAGHQVTLVDAMPAPGAGASYANGAQLSYSYVAPLADPSVWTQWPHYLFGSNSPLTLRLQADPAQWRWLLHFMADCTPRHVQRTTIALLRLAFFSRNQLAQLRTQLPFDFQHRTAGKLVMFSDEKALQSAAAQIAFQAKHGCQQQILDLPRCLEIEPALAASARQWAGGVYTVDEEVGDCALFCQGLVDAMSRQPGFRFLHSTRVTGVDVKNHVLRSITTSSGKIDADADAYVLALGVESADFAKRAGFSLPLYPLKGYSITVPLGGHAANAAPQVSITDLSRKIVYARLGDRLRVAGRVELVGMDRTITKRAIDELTRAVAEMFPACADLSDAAALSPWAGFRPTTPSGLPIIGASPIQNLYLNVGHGSLGWTLACGSAALLAARIAGKKAAIDDEAYCLHA